MFPGLDPSQMDPKMMAEISQLMRELTPDQLSRMQTLMHNMMGGFDVKRDMEEFERSLPPSFRERLGAMVSKGGPLPQVQAPQVQEASASSEPVTMQNARLTVLKGVAAGSLSPEEAERILFPET